MKASECAQPCYRNLHFLESEFLAGIESQLLELFSSNLVLKTVCRPVSMDMYPGGRIFRAQEAQLNLRHSGHCVAMVGWTGQPLANLYSRKLMVPSRIYQAELPRE